MTWLHVLDRKHTNYSVIKRCQTTAALSSEVNLLSSEGVPPRKPNTLMSLNSYYTNNIVYYIIAYTGYGWVQTVPIDITVQNKYDQLFWPESAAVAGMLHTQHHRFFSALPQAKNLPKSDLTVSFNTPNAASLSSHRGSLLWRVNARSRETRWTSRLDYLCCSNSRPVSLGRSAETNRGVALRFSAAALVGQQRTLAVRGTQCDTVWQNLSTACT